VYAEERGEDFDTHPDVEKYKLLRRTYYEQMPRGRFLRLVRAVGLMRRGGATLKPKLHALDVFRYGARAGSLRLLYAATPMLDKRPYDIVQCHFGVNGLKGVLLREIGAVRGKLVTSFHGYDLSRYTREFGRDVYAELFDKGDLFLPVSERWKERLVELGCPASKVLVHRMGVNLEHLAFEARRTRADGRVVIVSVARLVEKKGIEYGIRAVAKLVREGHKIVYRIVGDGALRGKLQSLIEELNVAGRVELMGWKRMPETYAILRGADVFLAPSVTSGDGDEEGIPVAIMEAMAASLPVVSTRHGSIPELVQEGISGLLLPERDAEGLAASLRRLVEHEQERVEMGRRGRLHVERHCDNSALNDALVEIYERLSGRANVAHARSSSES
jgi:colanic acid/amylovoran biosynthesis glycosyltransferase